MSALEVRGVTLTCRCGLTALEGADFALPGGMLGVNWGEVGRSALAGAVIVAALLARRLHCGLLALAVVGALQAVGITLAMALLIAPISGSGGSGRCWRWWFSWSTRARAAAMAAGRQCGSG